MKFDISKIRDDFPALQQNVHGQPLIYFDNAATSQKPKCVIDAVSNYYNTINSNVHRGVHHLSQRATEAFENAREHIRRYIHAEHAHEIIITKGATDSINLLANSYGKKYLAEGDEVIISALEHHANIVPWQMICSEKKASLKIIQINDKCELLLDELRKMISPKTKIISIGHISNAVGIINPVKEIINIAHENNVPVMIDGAQGIVHQKVDVQQMDCDFYCFSSHKFYGPMGVGILYGKEAWLKELPPYQTGGEMIKSVTFEKTTFNDLPYKFETGTPNVADVIGFDAALKYIEDVGTERIFKYEEELMQYAETRLKKTDGLQIICYTGEKAGVISFNLDGIHPYDAGTIIDKFGIAVRTGNHCAQPLMDRLNIQGTIRASFAFYNTPEEIDALAEVLKKVMKMFG